MGSLIGYLGQNIIPFLYMRGRDITKHTPNRLKTAQRRLCLPLTVCGYSREGRFNIDLYESDGKVTCGGTFVTSICDKPEIGLQGLG